MTVEEFRRAALALPEAEEGAHMGHPDFRVRKKIFATIWPGEGWGMVKLTREQQAGLVEAWPGLFVPVKGGWGERGATHVILKGVKKAAEKAAVRGAVLAAWRGVAPRRLVEELEAEGS